MGRLFKKLRGHPDSINKPFFGIEKLPYRYKARIDGYLIGLHNGEFLGYLHIDILIFQKRDGFFTINSYLLINSADQVAFTGACFRIVGI